MAQLYGRAFRNGLRALGWIEGRNITIEERFAEGEDERLPAIVDEILAMKPEVIVIAGARVVRAFREGTAVTPIVTAVVGDPVGSGFIASFAQPGGNVTGLAFQDGELITKRVGKAMPVACRDWEKALPDARWRPGLRRTQGGAQRQLQAWPLHRRDDCNSSVAEGDDP
jgi:hypothetical protein